MISASSSNTTHHLTGAFGLPFFAPDDSDKGGEWTCMRRLLYIPFNVTA
jgi:hypothetical protein